MALMSPFIVLSTPPPFTWLPDIDLMVGMTSCGLNLFTSVGLCLFIFLGTFSHNFLNVKAISPEEAAKVENHLLLGREFLARGQYSDALSQYHAAVGNLDFLGLNKFFVLVIVISEIL